MARGETGKGTGMAIKEQGCKTAIALRNEIELAKKLPYVQRIGAITTVGLYTCDVIAELEVRIAKLEGVVHG